MSVFGLVRDKNGNVKFDDWVNIPEKVFNSLSDKDRSYILEMRAKQNGRNA